MCGFWAGEGKDAITYEVLPLVAPLELKAVAATAGMAMCMLDLADERDDDSESVSEDDDAAVGVIGDDDILEWCWYVNI